MTSNIALRLTGGGDIPIFCDFQLDREANQMVGFPAKVHGAIMAHWAKILDEATIITKTILVNDRVAGNIMSYEDSGKREIGYWMGRDYWSQGISTSALATFLRLAETRPLYAHVATHNIASIQVLEKCGFAIVIEADDEVLLKRAA